MFEPAPATDLSRRNFLRSASAVAATAISATASGQVPLAPPDKQPPDLKVPGPKKHTNWAIVGLGQLALEQILPAIKMTDKCRVTALVSGHPDKARKVAGAYGVSEKAIYSYDNFDAIQENADIDVVYIVLPNSMHAEYTIRALKAGKHVFCEKPMASSADECRQMIAAQKETGKKLAIAYRLQYEPYNMKAIELARSGELGKPTVFEAQNTQDVRAPNIRLSKQLAGGPVSDVGIYCLNAARYMLGEEPTEVTALAHFPTDDERFREVPANVAFTLRFPSGALASCTCGFNGVDIKRMKTSFTKGAIDLDPAFPYQNLKLRVTQGQQTTQHDLPPENHFKCEMDAFSDAVLQNHAPKTPGEEGLRDVIIIDAIRESYENNGKLVKLSV